MRQEVKALFQAIKNEDYDATLEKVDKVLDSVSCFEEIINDENEFETPLHAAVKTGDMAFVELLLESPFSLWSDMVTRRDIHGKAAIGYTYDSVIKELLYKDMPKDGDFDFEAVREGNLKAVKRELERGRDINAVDRNGRTPLILTAWTMFENFDLQRDNPRLDMFKLLLEHNPDVNATDYWGETALSILLGFIPDKQLDPDWFPRFDPSSKLHDTEAAEAAELLLRHNVSTHLPWLEMSGNYPLAFRKMIIRYMLHKEPEFSTIEQLLEKQ